MTVILIVLQCFLVGLLIHLLRRAAVSRILSTFLAILIAMWFLIPVFVTVLFRDSVSFRFVVDYDLFVQYAILETAILLITLSFLLARQPNFRSFSESQWAQINFSPSVALFCLVLAIAISWLVPTLMGTLRETYQEHNAFAVTGQGTAEFNQQGGFDFVQNLSLCYGYACLLTKWPRGISTRLLYLFVTLWVLTTSLYQLLHGSRFGIITPFILLVILSQHRQWSLRKTVAIIAVAAIASVSAGGGLLLVVGQNRGTHELTLHSTTQGVMQILEDPQALSKLGQTLLVELVTKLDSFSTGAILIRYSGVGVSGWEAYKGAVLSLVPRFALPTKPVPGSADGTYSGLPGRITAAAMGMDPTSGNVQVSPGATTIWQLGYLGLAGLVIANVVQLYLINSLLLSRSFILKVVALYAIGIPTFLPLYASPDVVLMNLQRVLILYGGLFVLCKAVFRPRRAESEIQRPYLQLPARPGVGMSLPPESIQRGPTQSFDAFEYLVVDDGSSNKTLSILKEWIGGNSKTTSRP